MKQIEYRSITAEDYEVVRCFLADLGWRERVSDLTRFIQMMERADRTVIAFEGERVVGFARALCDVIA